MDNSINKLSSTKWSVISEQVREKRFTAQGKSLRLVEFSNSFVEKDWCIGSHIGYVVEGAIYIQFNSKKLLFKKGDEILIKGGNRNRHKASLEEHERALIILIEDA